MKRLLFLFVFSSFYIFSFAQTNDIKAPEKMNTIAIGIGQHAFFNVLNHITIPIGVMQINYLRKFNNGYGIKANYAFWGRNKNSYKTEGYIRLTLPDTNNIGKIAEMYNFQYLDVEAFKAFRIKKNHFAWVSLGASYTQSVNTYLEKANIAYYVFPDGTVRPHYINIEHSLKTVQYLGGILGLGYNYKLWKDRISLGADLKCRAYSFVPFHIVYGINVGYNF